MVDEGTQHSSTAANGSVIAVFVRTLERDLEQRRRRPLIERRPTRPPKGAVLKLGWARADADGVSGAWA